MWKDEADCLWLSGYMWLSVFPIVKVFVFTSGAQGRNLLAIVINGIPLGMFENIEILAKILNSPNIVFISQQ